MYICIKSTKLIIGKQIINKNCVNRTNLHGMKRSDGDDDSGASKRRRAVGLQCFSKRFSYSGLNILFPDICDVAAVLIPFLA